MEGHEVKPQSLGGIWGRAPGGEKILDENCLFLNGEGGLKRIEDG